MDENENRKVIRSWRGLARRGQVGPVSVPKVHANRIGVGFMEVNSILMDYTSAENGNIVLGMTQQGQVWLGMARIWLEFQYDQPRAHKF